MLVTDVLRLCDKDMDICIDMFNGASDYVAENYMHDNKLNFRAHEVLDSHLRNESLLDLDKSGETEKTIMKLAQTIILTSCIDNFNFFVARGLKIEHFDKLEVDFFDQNNQGQFVIHVKEI